MYLKEMALVILVLVYSGNPTPFLIFPKEPQLTLLAAFLSLLLIKSKRELLSKSFIKITGVFTVILIIQCISFRFYPFVTIAGFFIRLIIGYTLIRLIDNFPLVFVRAMVFIALISLTCHIPFALLVYGNIGVENIIIQIAEKIGTATLTRWPLFLHTFLSDIPPRNAGMFWEPGAFSGYLIMGLVFLSLAKNEFSKRDYRIYLIILSLSIITTRSTTGYVVYPFALLLHYDWSAFTLGKRIERGLLAFFIIIPLIVTIGFVSYRNLDFLKNKIEKQFQSVEVNREGWHLTRFGTLLFDWEYIKSRPFTGWGLHEDTRYVFHPRIEDLMGMGNGFSDFTAKFGMLGMTTWLLSVFIGFRRLIPNNQFQPIHIMFIIVLLLQGEQFLNHPFWIGLAFLDSPEINHEYSSNHKSGHGRILIRW
jgi:hypothetical protein